ncbi:schwannomin-interacting protein 1 isoform X1 [Gadus macrocephalus]|uniref:schwannomin-interacting protein 1 isoform X1 n=1 Tax=Gadus macrocephalus TaxID=80720 RepID=UPI0028CB1355|nr:schwannomin-interacting protein 1 isoform X1 [Gadus macrocephalus]
MEVGSTEEETTEEKDGDGRHLPKEEQEEGSGDLYLTSLGDQHLPIMHWEDLSLRIAELEKQEQQKRERAESSSSFPGEREEERRGELWRAPWGDREDDQGRRCRVSVVTSRFHNHKNLQLCFINNSDSDEEEGFSARVSPGAGGIGSHPSGLKDEVTAALRALRDNLVAEERGKEQLASGSIVAQRKHLELPELHNCSMQQLRALEASLQQDIHELSSELVSQLLVRDQLRTKQDAMLLDVQDLT